MGRLRLMKARTGRPPKLPEAGAQYSTLTIRLAPHDKELLVVMAEGYGMSMTEYIVALLKRDSSNAVQAD